MTEADIKTVGMLWHIGNSVQEEWGDCVEFEIVPRSSYWSLHVMLTVGSGILGKELVIQELCLDPSGVELVASVELMAERERDIFIEQLKEAIGRDRSTEPDSSRA